MNDPKLKQLRNKIDAIDEQIHDLLRQRIAIVKEVGTHKAGLSGGRHFLRPAREADMLKRIESIDLSGFPKAAAAAIWRMVIAGSLYVEDPMKVSAYGTEQDMTCYWLAREYMGAFTQLTTQPVTSRIIGDIIDGTANIGALPPLNEKLRQVENTPWWVALAHTIPDTRPHIFALAPYIKAASNPSKEVILIGNVTPEATGDDTSFLALTLSGTTSRATVAKLFDAMDITTTFIDEARSPIDPNLQCQLFSVNTFINEEHKSYAQLTKKLGAELTHGCVLGAYANPISYTV